MNYYYQVKNYNLQDMMWCDEELAYSHMWLGIDLITFYALKSFKHLDILLTLILKSMVKVKI